MCAQRNRKLEEGKINLNMRIAVCIQRDGDHFEHKTELSFSSKTACGMIQKNIEDTHREPRFSSC